MRKIISFFAFVAIVLTFAACNNGGNSNEPEVKGFTFNVDVISTRVHVTVTPSDPNKFYYWSAWEASDISADHTVRDCAETELASNKYDEWLEWGEFMKGQSRYSLCYQKNENTKYYVYACYVEKGDNGYAQIVGDVASQEFTTYRYHTLQPVFSNNSHFCSCNVGNGAYEYGQWEFWGQPSGDRKDFYTWSEFKNMTLSNGFYTPDVNNWLRIFRTREHADELFTLASIMNISYHPCYLVNGTVHGLIILPDDWQEPQGVTLKSAKQIGFVWNETEQAYKASSESFDGYAQNKLDEKTDWWALEKAGAVFLPAAGVNGGGQNSYGWYWANSETDKPRAFSFSKNQLYLKNLSTNVVPVAGHYSSIRRVREVE